MKIKDFLITDEAAYQIKRAFEGSDIITPTIRVTANTRDYYDEGVREKKEIKSEYEMFSIDEDEIDDKYDDIFVCNGITVVIHEDETPCFYNVKLSFDITDTGEGTFYFYRY